MRIVIDTNVLISGVFFGGFPRKILSAVVGQNITAYATAEIISEYEEKDFSSQKQALKASRQTSFSACRNKQASLYLTSSSR